MMPELSRASGLSIDEAQRAIDSLAKDTPGGVAMAYVEARNIAFFTSGKFSSEDLRQITPDTQFEAASIAKLFTALLLAKSELLGKVNRKDPVGKYLLPADDPDAEKLSKITLLLLATHHSGLPREPSNLPTAGLLD